MHADGSLDLAFGGTAVLKGGCPALGLTAPPSKARTSLCGADASASTEPPRRGTDARMGPYTATRLVYNVSSRYPASALEFRA